jgi:hypothetical protein
MSAPLSLKLATSEAAYDEVKGCLRIVASIAEPDSDGEVVDPSTLRLDAYRKNPIVLWAHDQKQFPVAKCEDPAGNFTCWVEDNGGMPRMVQEWYFADTPQAREIESLYRQGVLRGASVGFIKDGYRTIPADKAHSAWGIRKQLKLVTGGELRETSAIPVPACPGALALAWINMPAAAGLMQRGVSNLVTKSLKPFFPEQAFRDVTISAPTGAGPVSKPSDIANNATTAVIPANVDVAAVAVALSTKAEESSKSKDTDDSSGVMFHELAKGYLAKMFETDDPEEHKKCMKCIKTAHSDHMKYKGLESGDDEGDESESEKRDEPEEVEKAFREVAKEEAELVMKGYADQQESLSSQIVAQQARIDQLEAALADRPTVEEVAEVIAAR